MTVYAFESGDGTEYTYDETEDTIDNRLTEGNAEEQQYNRHDEEDEETEIDVSAEDADAEAFNEEENVETTEEEDTESTDSDHLDETGNDDSNMSVEPEQAATPESDFEWNGDIITGYLGEGGDIVIPARAREIGDRAFWGCTGLRQVVFPEGLEVVGERAFKDCTGIKQIDLPAGLKSIGSEAFYETGISELVIPESVQSIGSEAFSYCDNLRKVTILSKKFEVEYFWGDANFGGPFAGNRLNDLVLSEEMTYIPKTLFGSLEFEKGYVLVLPETVTDIGDNAFAGIEIERVVLPDSLEVIADGSFFCANVAELIIPDGVKSIGSGAFNSATIPELIIPESVKTIGDYAFHELEADKVEIKSGDFSAGEHLFSDCCIECIVLPDDMTAIPDSMFEYDGDGEGLYIGHRLKKITTPGSKNMVQSQILCDG